MTDRDKDVNALEKLFAAGRDAETPSDQFVARLMADASGAVDRNAPSESPQRKAPRPSFWQTWLPVSGLTAATLAGVWIGSVFPHSDIGSEYLAGIGASDIETGGFSPTFGVAVLLEDFE